MCKKNNIPNQEQIQAGVAAMTQALHEIDLKTLRYYTEYEAKHASKLCRSFNGELAAQLCHVLEQMASESWTQRPREQQEQILQLLSEDALKTLLPQIQGIEDSGSASDPQLSEAPVHGQYISSPLSCISQLLLENRLSADLLAALTTLSQAELNPALGELRQHLFHSTLHNITFPHTISQHDKHSCAAARIEILMALDNPSTYVETIYQLASPTAQVRQIGGALLRYQPESFSQRQCQRSAASQLLQTALMAYADLAGRDDRTPRVAQAKKKVPKHELPPLTGLSLEETRRLLSTILGDQRIACSFSISGSEALRRTQVLEKVEHLLALEQAPLLLDLEWGGNGEHGIHAVLLTFLDENFAYFMNPWGELNTMIRKDFNRRVHGVIALKEPPQMSSHILDKGQYKPLAPEHYLSTQELEELGFARALNKRAQQIHNPRLSQAVLNYLGTLSTREEYLDFAPLLSDYIYAERSGFVESEERALRKIVMFEYSEEE